MRIAFVTPEYPTEFPDGGGLATYVWRMAHLLTDRGHDVEVFTAVSCGSSVLQDGPVRVHRVDWRSEQRYALALHSRLGRLMSHPWWWYVAEQLLQSRGLGAALERRHDEAPFRIVQSSDYRAVGLFIKRESGRTHVVRCSSAADLYNAADGRTGRFDVAEAALERAALRRGDVAYAPSRFVADHYKMKHGIEVGVVRPPAAVVCVPSQEAAEVSLPLRYLLHFGQLMDRKGTDIIARALPIAWKIEPALTMVWAGRCGNPDRMLHWRSLWGEHASKVHVIGALPRAPMQTVLRGALASVLPSLVDNLPNTVIESLAAGIPVIGSAGASIDEIVEDGITGRLVPVGDVEGLAEAMVVAWRRETPIEKGFVWESSLAAEMQQDCAVKNFLRLRLAS